MWLLGKGSSKREWNIKGRKYVQVEQIAEGGFAFLHKIQSQSGQQFAMKQMLCQDKERLSMARTEGSILQNLRDNPNIIQLSDYGEETEEGVTHVYMIMELAQGSLANILETNQRGLPVPQILEIAKCVINALKSIHDSGYAHRDIKIENILLINNTYKLCDFGSCSKDNLELSNMQHKQLTELEEGIDKSTTMMYRPPELADVHTRKPINTKVDMWMLGCVLFTLAYCQHPFQNGGKLTIVNVQFRFPDQRVDGKFQDLIRLLLCPEPQQRPSAQQFEQILNQYNSITQIPLPQIVQEIKQQQITSTEMYQKNQRIVQNSPVEIPIEELQAKANMIRRQQQSGMNQRSQGSSQQRPNQIRRPQEVFQEWTPPPQTSNNDLDLFSGFGEETKMAGQSTTAQPQWTANFNSMQSQNQQAKQQQPRQQQVQQMQHNPQQQNNDAQQMAEIFSFTNQSVPNEMQQCEQPQVQQQNFNAEFQQDSNQLQDQLADIQWQPFD